MITTSSQHYFGMPINQDKEIKVLEIGRGKIVIILDNMIIYIGNLKTFYN